MDKILALTFPAGKIPYVARQTKAMTTGTDTESLTVPAGKRWLVCWGWMTNNSGAAITVRVSGLDASDIELGRLQYIAALANGGIARFPAREGTADNTILGSGAYPFLLDAGMKLSFVWGADAGKSGNSYCFAMIREF